MTSNADETLLPDEFLEGLIAEVQWETGEKVMGKQTLYQIIAELLHRRRSDSAVERVVDGWVWFDISTLPDDDHLILAHCPPDGEFPDGRTMIWRASMLFAQFARIKSGIAQPRHLSFPATLWAEIPAPPDLRPNHSEVK